MIGVFLAVAASTGIDGAPEETTLRCIDCPEVQVHRVIDGDTLDTQQGPCAVVRARHSRAW